MNIPNHIAIIMDGNGRWAKSRNKLRIFGHLNGVRALEDIVSQSNKIGIKYLTLFAFSCENWKRPVEETDYIMKLLISSLSKKNIDKMIKNNIKFNWIGFKEKMSSTILNTINNTINSTRHCSGLNLIMAINYGGTQDLEQAFANRKKYNCLKEAMLTKDLPNVDLLIRTGDEKRISNFLIYETAYAEIIFESALWPEYNSEIFMKNIIEYNNRDRRFGKIDGTDKN